MKKVFLMILAVLFVVSSIAVFAEDNQSLISKVTGISDSEIAELREQGVRYGQLFPASVIAKRLNMSVKDVIALRESGKSYYAIATEKGIKAEDYKADLLIKKNTYIDEQVKAGTLTADQGKTIKANMETRIQNCDGQNAGQGCGQGGMMGGFGQGRGQGRGMGRGQGGMMGGAGCGMQFAPAN